jgi:predicted O-methyltransferase YrrM
MSASSIAGELVVGPMVATILVWRMVAASLQSTLVMHQLIAPAVVEYLARLHPPLEPVVEVVRAEGLADGLPLSDAATARLLRALVLALGARRVLEVGTAIGYSAMVMALAMPPDGLLLTMEADAGRAATARRNFARGGIDGRVNVIVGDASRFLHKVAGPFDLVFQDGNKQLYEPMLDHLVAHLRPGGVLLSDNILWRGEVIDGFVDRPRHDPADTEAIRRYNMRLAGDARLLTCFLPVGDGVALSVRLA